MPILSAEERVGRTLDGKYEIGAPIATGGMGVVYRGKHTWTGRDVAIKVLQPGLSLDPDISRRFLTEARASATLRHPNVVDVLDMGRDEDGTLYMVLELLEGRDLDELLAERSVLAPEEAIPAIAPILDALAFAHEKGFVHRDIKPSNIYLATDARGVVIPKILDFGIAKALDGGANKATRTGVIIGTPHYMAPEQASGVGVIGPATDTWAIGVLLFQALTGTVPFDGASPTMILMNVLGKRARPVCEVSPSVPGGLGALVDAMLDPDPDARPADLRELAKELRALLPNGVDESAVLAALVRVDGPRALESSAATLPGMTTAPSDTARVAPPAPVRSPRRPEPVPTAPRPPWAALAVGLVVAAMVGAGVWWVSRPGPAPTLPPETAPASASAGAAPTPPSTPTAPSPATDELPATPPPTTPASVPEGRSAPVRAPSSPPRPPASSGEPGPVAAPEAAPPRPAAPEASSSPPAATEARRPARPEPATPQPLTEVQEQW